MPYIPQETWIEDFNRLENEGPKSSNLAPNPGKPRASGTSADVNDDQVGYDSPFATLQPGTFRSLWRQPEVVISAVKVISLKGTVSKGSQDGVYQGGVLNSPTTTLSSYTTVPDLIVTLRTSAPVQVEATIQCSSDTANAVNTFTIFRDGIQVGREYAQSGNVVGNPFIVRLSVFDNPNPGQHNYSVQWRTSGGTLTANGLNRSMQAFQPK